MNNQDKFEKTIKIYILYLDFQKYVAEKLINIFQFITKLQKPEINNPVETISCCGRVRELLIRHGKSKHVEDLTNLSENIVRH